MILEKHSNLLMAGGYPFLVMYPYHWLRALISRFWEVPSDAFFTSWWQTSTMRTDILGARALESDFSWISVFQNHDFLIFQHGLALLALLCGYALVRKYFGFSVGIIFMLLFGLSPLSLEWPSCTLPEWLQGAFLVFWLYFADKAKEAQFQKKLLLYALLGALSALGFLIKFNSLPVFVILFAGLVFWERMSLWRVFVKISVTLAAALCVVGVFVATHHFPTTGTTSLTMNSWPLADKVFQFLPHPSLMPEMGLQTKRLLAIHKHLPKHNEKVLGPAPYFRNIGVTNEERTPYRKKLSFLMRASDQEMDRYLSVNGFDPIHKQPPALRVAYYIGLEEYSSLLKGIYVESIKRYPLSFLQNTARDFFSNFAMKENSYFFHPQLKEVQKGRDTSQASRLGFVKFLWPNERYVCYHENVVWLPGVWFFTHWQALWPPTWVFWLFSLIAFAVACKNLAVDPRKIGFYLTVFLFLTAVFFVWISNMIWTFRLKEYELIRVIPTLLAAVGLCQSYRLACQWVRAAFFKYKFRKISEAT
ncbi:MAG TPA: hypothetical protein VGM34_00065 [Chlamydiales bacterium]